ncbi:GNAT family N-acetyltransferase [Pseudochryseolinea flava]|uniref:GNAT family N-acetyltransferase n=1 Tax=Pseudochryseolinea flava TaxID=2059302 RepID=A0A364Y7M4_9BACT|nr:GNAT family N-acetyltransferase [Pseudochryseolinea flava]RAW02261.1 GNAT family N-acetyltransferase [Pseudochryseolinea flava]
MVITQGTLNDIAELCVLFNDYRVFYGKPGDLHGARRFLHERMRNHESIIFLARSNTGELTGFVQLYPIFSSTRMRRLWLLNDLFVVPAHRGTGTSVALMDAAKYFSRETESCGLVLETAKTNLVANRLYQRLGFEMDNDHNYYAWND